MAGSTKARADLIRIEEEDLVATYGVRWGVRPSQTRAPSPRDSDVERPELIERFRSVGADLVTVVAPPGYGKTTLAAQYARSDPRATVWLSLVRDGNDAVTTARSLALALSAVAPIDDDLLTELIAVRPRLRVLTAGLCASVDDASEPFLFVIDDLHLLTDPAANELLIAISNEMPQGSQMILATRHLGSLDLAQARLREDYLAIGVADLRFGSVDAALLLRGAGADDLTEEEVASLTEQTEGWAVGLYLAALSGTAGATTEGGPSFGGDDRFVADYLREHVLSQLPGDEVDFLVRTSLLDELSGPLCDAVLETSGSGARLEALEDSNLLVVPLDHRRERFRYHHLFRDLLRQELEHRAPELVPLLASRASDWCESQGAFDLAIGYAQEGGLIDRVADLVARYGQMAYMTGRAGEVLRWLTWLDDHDGMERLPFVAGLGGWTMALDGRPFEAQRWADAAARASEGRGDDAEAVWRLLRAAMCRDGAEAMRHDVDQAAEILSPVSPWIPHVRFLSGLAQVLSGDVGSAEEWFRSSAERGAEMGLAPATCLALVQLAMLALARSDPESAARDIEQALDIIEATHLHGYPSSVMTFAVAARIAIIQGDPARARRSIQNADDYRSTLTIALPSFAVQVRIQLLWSALALFDIDSADVYLTEADELLSECGDLGVLAVELETARGQVEVLRSSRPGVQALTPAEARLLPFLTTHRSFREIGEQLYVSPHTVKTQAISIYRKLGVTSRAEAVETARKVGLLS